MGATLLEVEPAKQEAAQAAQEGDLMNPKPETINRTHDLAYHTVSIHLVHTPGITSLWKVQESYKGKDLFHWYEDQNAVRYRVCDRSLCGQYGKKTETKLKWVCDPCKLKEAQAAQSQQEKQNYRKRFEIRIAQACGDARKQLPSLNVRKARKGDRLVFTHHHGAEEEINAVLMRHNLKLGYTSRLEHPNAPYGRRQAEVKEFNPMRTLEKTLNGEADE